jgi:hypothetical protein
LRTAVTVGPIAGTYELQLKDMKTVNSRRVTLTFIKDPSPNMIMRKKRYKRWYLYQEPWPLRNKYVCGDIVNGRLFYLNIDQPLSDSTVYELTVMQNGKETNFQEMSKTKRQHLRVAYDPYKKDLYIITKVDGKIRRIATAYE